MICYAIYHHSDCTCGSCLEDNRYNSDLFMDEDTVLEAIQNNPMPSQYSDKGSHTIYEIKYELAEDGFRFPCQGFTIFKEYEIQLNERIFIGNQDVMKILCDNSEKQYTIKG